MSKEKQIEIPENEMGRSGYSNYSWKLWKTKKFTMAQAELADQIMREEGYRKQSEGEWIKTETNSYCSECKENVISWSGEYDGFECERSICLMKYCPNCGAKMQGGE